MSFWEVLDACPPPEECEGLDPDEFEALVRSRMVERGSLPKEDLNV